VASALGHLPWQMSELESAIRLSQVITPRARCLAAMLSYAQGSQHGVSLTFVLSAEMLVSRWRRYEPHPNEIQFLG
jgi:hypothetical protein